MSIDAFLRYCEEGNVAKVKQLLAIPIILSDRDFESAFSLAVTFNHVEIVSALYDSKPANDNILLKSVKTGIRSACEDDHLEMVKLLFELNPSIVLEQKDRNLFIMACVNDFLDIAKWLFNVYKDNNKSLSRLELENIKRRDVTPEVREWLDRIMQQGGKKSTKTNKKRGNLKNKYKRNKTIKRRRNKGHSLKK
jgi:ankyrin repeat protein